MCSRPSSSSKSPFQDDGGLIAFTNLSSTLSLSAPAFAIGQSVCDQVCNFFATIRSSIFTFLVQNPNEVLPGDKVPVDQWDFAVTHYMEYLLDSSGGVSGSGLTDVVFSEKQDVEKFSDGFVELMMDTSTAPLSISNDVTKFIQDLGGSIRTQWSNKGNTFNIIVMGQCHEAISATNSPGQVFYVPKIKCYSISADASQKCFTSICSPSKSVSFDFRYECYTTILKDSVLDPASQDHKDFLDFLGRAQEVKYTNAPDLFYGLLPKAISS